MHAVQLCRISPSGYCRGTRSVLGVYLNNNRGFVLVDGCLLVGAPHILTGCGLAW